MLSGGGLVQKIPTGWLAGGRRGDFFAVFSVQPGGIFCFFANQGEDARAVLLGWTAVSVV